MGQFKGYGPQALSFFKALAFHQDRAWFQENKPLYESDVRDPTVALLEDLSARFAEGGVPLRGDAKSVFRLHRDIRFSNDKRPFKTHSGAVMTRSGSKNDPGLLYIHIDPEGSFAAAGFHMPEPPTLAAFRASIRRRPEEWDAMVKALARAKLELSDEGSLTRVPRGFEDLKGTSLEGAVRLKSFIVSIPLTEADLARPALVGKIATFAGKARPLLDFGWAALG